MSAGRLGNRRGATATGMGLGYLISHDSSSRSDAAQNLGHSSGEATSSKFDSNRATKASSASTALSPVASRISVLPYSILSGIRSSTLPASADKYPLEIRADKP